MKSEPTPPFWKTLLWRINTKGICFACFAILLVWIVFSGCKKDTVEPDPIPFLKIESVSPTNLVEFTDSVIVLLTYDDGDGDLGFFDPDSSALAVTDSRFSEPDYYFVEGLAPDNGESLHIRGTLRVGLTPPFILGNGNTEVIQYSIRIKDRAGNWSNTVVTPDITITK